jgi:hypothetical protein
LTPTSSSITANGTATQVLTVTAKDANGNLETSGGSAVTITKQSGTGSIGSVSDNGNGTYTATVTAPTATGSGVFVGTLGGNPVKSGGASQTQATVSYLPGPATKLVFTQQPTDANAGATITPAVTVSVEDANNNVVTTDQTTKVTLAIGTNPGGGTLTGGGQVTVVNGVATYSGLSISAAGNGYTLSATDTTGVGGGHPYASTTSNTFNIIATTLTYSATGVATTWLTNPNTAKNVAYPAGTNTNDLLLLVYIAANNQTPTVPAGWTLLTTDSQGANVMTRVYWKLAAAADGGQVSVTSGNSNNADSAWVVRYVRPGGYPPNPDVATATPNHGNANSAPSVTTNGVTTNQANATVISIVGEATTGTLSLSTANGYARENQTSANGLSFGIADELVGTSGTATSAPIWSSTASAAWAWSTDAFH